jgi:hypothetical protein
LQLSLRLVDGKHEISQKTQDLEGGRNFAQKYSFRIMGISVNLFWVVSGWNGWTAILLKKLYENYGVARVRIELTTKGL